MRGLTKDTKAAVGKHLRLTALLFLLALPLLALP
jgi:hypothetical protein